MTEDRLKGDLGRERPTMREAAAGSVALAALGTWLWFQSMPGVGTALIAGGSVLVGMRFMELRGFDSGLRVLRRAVALALIVAVVAGVAATVYGFWVVGSMP